jgi:hypothetical protein
MLFFPSPKQWLTLCTNGFSGDYNGTKTEKEEEDGN